MSSADRAASGLFLGCDGGGTKTAFRIVSGDGREIGAAETTSSYFLEVGIDEAEAVVARGVGEVCRAAGILPSDIEYSFFGLPAYGEVSSMQDRLDALPRAALGHDRYSCGNDMICGWAGSLGAVDGVNIVAGTGSMTYGERNGKGMRCGGWGETFGDEGSAYWIAARGLAAFSRMSDGRAPRTALHAAFVERLEISTDLDAVDVVLNRWRSDRTKIATLAPLVVELAEAGDEAAAAIVEDAVEELGILAVATMDGLGFGRDELVPVSYSGGLFRSPRILAAFEAALAGCLYRCELRRPLHEPAVGAALYAAKLAGKPIAFRDP